MASDIVQDMQAYYAQRAAEYERVYHKPERQADLRAMERWIGAADGPFAGRRVLEIACGTGWWTSCAARHANDWLATDVNPETIAIARTKPLPACVRLAEVDAYTLAGLEGASSGRGAAGAAPSFDAAFAGFWWSHVPLSRLAGWLQRLHERLPAGARVVFLDNAYVPGSSTPIARTDAEGNTYQVRRLDDGSVHEVLKNFPSREQAVASLGARVRRPRWHAWAHYWALEYETA